MQSDPLQPLRSALLNQLPTLPDRAAELAADPATPFQTLQTAAAMLAYHDARPALQRLLHDAWPHVRTNTTINSATRGEFAAQAADVLVYDFLERANGRFVPPPELQANLAVFFEIDLAGLQRYIDTLTGRAEPAWQLADFVPDAPRDAAPDVHKRAAHAVAERLATLMILFTGYLRRTDQVAYTRAALVRPLLPAYFTLRRSGQLAPRQPIAELMQGKRPFPVRSEAPPHPLGPERTTLTRYLERLLHAARPQPYRAAALFGALPAWLHFLRDRQLLDAAQEAHILADLAPLAAELQPVWANQPDPTLATNLQPWPEGASTHA